MSYPVSTSFMSDNCSAVPTDRRRGQWMAA